jgi:hypothetical protein
MAYRRTFGSTEQLLYEELHPINADNEADEVGRHHHQDIENRAEGADVPIPGLISILRSCRSVMLLMSRETKDLGFRKDVSGCKLWYDEQANEPAPSQEPEGQIVPQRHEREDE